jgi:cell wall-associated NlpC family hydrolase
MPVIRYSATVGIYIGSGRMVDAPYAGASVRIDSTEAYPGLIGATRPASWGVTGGQGDGSRRHLSRLLVSRG